jgi:carbon storage regulator
MLVLTRHCGEQIVIADEILVTVVAIEGNKVRLGVTAPKSVRVDRMEVHQRRAAEEDRPSFVEYELEMGNPVG